jgi:DNA-binding cell septation regulator SpoVG
MSIEITRVTVTPVADQKTNTVAYVNFTINNALAINSARLVSSDKGLFLAMPSKSRKDPKTGEITWRDICFPINKETRTLLQTKAIEEFNKTEQEDSAV